MNADCYPSVFAAVNALLNRASAHTRPFQVVTVSAEVASSTFAQFKAQDIGPLLASSMTELAMGGDAWMYEVYIDRAHPEGDLSAECAGAVLWHANGRRAYAIY